MKKLALSAMALFLLASGNAVAQKKKEKSKNDVDIKLVNTRDSDLEIVEEFAKSMNEYRKDPSAPRFLLYDQKNKVAFGIGGNVRVRTAYDFGGSPTSAFGFLPSTIPVPKNYASRERFNIDPYKSTLFFKLLGNNDKVGQFSAYLSGQFIGTNPATYNNNAFVINDAYIKVACLTLGQTWSTFNDMGAVPPTVDEQGPNGAAELRTPQIRVTTSLAENVTFAIAVEKSLGSNTYTSVNANMPQRVPNIPAYLQVNFGESAASHFRLAGVLTNTTYRNLEKDKTESATGYGVQFSTDWNITPIFEFYGQITYGKGISQYINDLSGNGFSLVSKPSKPGKAEALEALGWYANMQINLTPNVFCSFGYSQAKIFPKSDLYLPSGSSQDPTKPTLTPSDYRYGQYVVANVFYNVTQDFQVGAEVLWGNRVNLNGDNASAKRIQAIVQYNF